MVIRTNYLADSSLIARHLLDSQWVVCASPAYIARLGRPYQPHMLSTHNCLLYTYQTAGASEWKFKGPVADYMIKVSGTFPPIMQSHFEKRFWGYGIAYIPRCLVYHDLCEGTLVDLFPLLAGKN
ncbi:LysR substrate-binding domain-containing protein [Vibrio sp. PP-XX7]